MTGRRVRAGGGLGRGPQPAADAARAHGRVDRRHRRRGRRGRRRRRTCIVDEADNDAPIIKLVHSIVAQAIQQGASDIHVNPEEGDTRVLFRVDGVLVPGRHRSSAGWPMGVVSRIKIMADLDISEKRVPQDGRFALTVDGRRVDIRVVTLPLVYGEGVVLRILDKGVVVDEPRVAGHAGGRAGALRAGDPAAQRRRARHRADRLGQVDHALRRAERRSTTASAASSRSRTRSSSASPGIKQMQIAPKAGVTFDVGLRSMLRADPDVIMVGEIRDRETAHIAVEAALTGHLVLSTLHTRDAPERARTPDRHGHRAVPRLLGGRLHRRPAPRAHAVQALQAPAERLRGGARRARAGGRRAVRAGRLLALRRCAAIAAASDSTR